MKIGVLTGIWFIAEGATIIESLERAAALGFHYVDLHGVFHAGPAHLMPEEQIAVKHEMEMLGLKPRSYVCHAPHNIPSATDDEIQESFIYLKEAIDLASMWGINQVMLNAGMWAYGLSREQAWAKSAHFLKDLCDYAAPREIFIAQEAEPYVWFLVNDITSTVRMMEDVDRPNFATLIDLGHMALAREGPQDLHRLGDSIIHAHFSDHEPSRHSNQIIGTGFTHTLDYLNELRAMEIDKGVERFGYSELVISLELGMPSHRIDDADKEVISSLGYVLQVAPYITLD